MLKVSNMLSSRGNCVPNQFIIKTDAGDYFQSYETIIAFIGVSIDGIHFDTILDTNALNYSKTTSKYLYQFLGMGRKMIENKIKEGEIILKNLNNGGGLK